MSDEAAFFAISPGRGDIEELATRLPVLARHGVGRFLLRERTVDAGHRRAMAQTLRPLCRDLGIEFWVSRDAGLARDVEADGVHLPEDVTPPRDMTYGVSLHERSRRPPVERDAAAHAFFGPVFSTPSKAGILEPIGPARFARAAGTWTPPTYALGGIDADGARQLVAEGVRRVAGIRLFFDADPTELERIWEVLNG